MESPFSTSGNPGRYLMLTSWKDTCMGPAALVTTDISLAVVQANAVATKVGYLRLRTYSMGLGLQCGGHRLNASGSTTILIHCHFLQFSNVRMSLTVTMPQGRCSMQIKLQQTPFALVFLMMESKLIK